MVKRAALALGMAAWLMVYLAIPVRAQSKKDSSAAGLVSRALAASDIEAKGEPAFRLEARVRIRLGGGQSEDGKLAWVWTPAGWWHRELAFSEYRSLGIYDGNKLWTKRTVNYLPFPAFLTERAVGFWNWLRGARGQKLSDPERSPATGETCVSTVKSSDSVRYCFDQINGNLASVADRRWNVTFRYLKYAPFGTKRFPRRIEVARSGGNAFVEIHVVQLSEEQKPNLRLFLPVRGAKETPSAAFCREVKEAKLKKMVRPKYPKAAENAGVTGVVKLYADIGGDGIPRGMWPVNTAAPVLTRAAIDAVSQWRYRPSVCEPSGAGMPQVQAITIVFSSR